jgi:hypothetical protein
MRQAELREVVSEQVVDVHDLVDLLELTIEDILAKHPKRLREMAHKFGVILETSEAEE